MESTEALRTYYSRVTPMIPELFNMAYAICGNYDLAEYALQYTLMEAWVGESHGGMGFREGLRNTLRRVAVEEALEPRTETVEFTWNGLSEDSDDPVLKILAQESADVRRLVALKYGCGLPVGRIARLADMSTGNVRITIERFERKVSRRLPPQEKRRFDAVIASSVGQQFARQDAAMPSLGAVYRSFVAEAMETKRPSHLAARIVRRVLYVVLVVACALVFWLAAALMQPVNMEAPQAQTEISAK